MIVTVLMSRMPEGSTLREVVECTPTDPDDDKMTLRRDLSIWVKENHPGWDFDGYIEMEDQDEVQTG